MDVISVEFMRKKSKTRNGRKPVYGVFNEEGIILPALEEENFTAAESMSAVWTSNVIEFSDMFRKRPHEGTE